MGLKRDGDSVGDEGIEAGAPRDIWGQLGSGLGLGDWQAPTAWLPADGPPWG